MVAPLVFQICMLLAGSALIVQQIVRPRLPVYKISIRGLPLPTKSLATGEWKTAIKSNIELFNANYLHLDVHALHFDLYTSKSSTNNDGSNSNKQVLRHIGNIQDREQHQIQRKPRKTKQQRNEGSSNSNKQNKETKPVRTTSTSETAVWSLEARSNFTTTATLYMTTNFGAVLSSLSLLIARWWHSSGRLTLPTTGVVHIRAVSKTAATTASSSTQQENGGDKNSKSPAMLKAPFTVSIICDNLVDTWKLQVLGLECALHNMVPGWVDLATAAGIVRDYAESKMSVNATGGILQHPKMSWEDVLSTIAWEESMQLL